MKTIVVHTPQNEMSRHYRYYNYFWFDFVEYLKTKFIVIEDTYYENANLNSYPVKLYNGIQSYDMLECEMIIENLETGEFVVMSVSDTLTATILGYQSNPKCKKILVSQFDRDSITNHLSDSENIKKFSPWIYFPSNMYDIESMYQYRKEQLDLVDKFCFWGTSIQYRPILNHFDESLFDWGLPIGDFYTYSKKLLQYKVALSISGRAEFCYRDIENFGMGIPIIRFEYKNELYNKLIPNYHYISVERPDDLPIDREGDERHAKMIEEKFMEVKDNLELLNFISDNAKDYYNQNLSQKGAIGTTYQILDLSKWE